MKSHAKSKRRTAHARHAAPARTHRTAHPHRKHPAAKSSDGLVIIEESAIVGRLEDPQAGETFTPMETGSPDRDEGTGPLGQEGEGEAQNDQLAALEETKPDDGADI